MTTHFKRFGATTLTIIAAAGLALVGGTAAHADDAIGVQDDYYGVQGTPFHIDAPGVLANDVCAGTKNLYDVENFYSGEVVIDGTGWLTYLADPGFVGTRSFDYAWSCDGVPVPGLTHVTVTFSPAVPVGAADAYSTQEGVVLDVPAPGLLANDTGGVAVVDIQNLPDGLNAQLDGSFIYTPPAGTLGDVSFSYRMSDGSDTFSDWIPVTITVTAAPVVTEETPTPPAPAADIAATDEADGATLAHTGETPWWLLTPALALLVAGCSALLFAGRRRDAEI